MNEPTIGHNGLDMERAGEYFERVIELHQQKATEAARYAADINEVYGEAHNELGIPRKALKILYREYIHNKKLKELDNDVRSIIDDLRVGLGDFIDTPLGQAALDLEEAAE